MSSAVNHRYPAVQGEYEEELESELEAEDELEDEFEAHPGASREQGHREFEDEDELELEDEFEMEDEAFLGALSGIARSVGGLLGEYEDEDEDEDEDEFEFEFEAEAEAEDEGEGEDEDEAFANPVRRVYRDAELMAHLARSASDAEGEEEAEAFIGALVPIAARLIPRAAALLTRNAPALIRQAGRITRTLRRDPATRRLVRAMPVVLQRTAQSLADQAATGRPITAGTTASTLARMAGRVLSDPHSCRSALGAVGVFDRRYRRRLARWRATDQQGGYGGTGYRSNGYGPRSGSRSRPRAGSARRSSGAVPRARRAR